MKFRLIEDQRDTFRVRAMCDVLSVSPAGYYAWRSRPESHRKAVNRALLAEIRRVHAVPTTMRIELDFSAKHIAVRNRRPRAESKSARGLQCIDNVEVMREGLGEIFPGM